MLLIFLLLGLSTSTIRLRSGALSERGVDPHLEDILVQTKDILSTKLTASALRKDFVHMLVEVEDTNGQTQKQIKEIISNVHSSLHVDLMEETKMMFIPDNGFSFLAHPEVVNHLSQLDAVKWVGHFKAEYKFSDITVPFPSEQFADPAYTVLLADSSVTAQDVSDDLNSRLQEADINARVQVASPRQLVLVAPKKSAERAVQVAAQIEQAAWIQPMAQKQMKNNDATWILQSGVPSTFPVFDFDIRGQNQVIGVSDSGADFTNCLLDDTIEPTFCESACSVRDTFQDPNCWDEFLLDPSTWCEPADSMSCDFSGADCSVPNEGAHRKIPVYWPFNDKLDDAVGHGTHVSGSITGQYPDVNHPIAPFHGGAPLSQIVFLDGSPNAYSNGLFFPIDLYTNYFPFFAQNNAMVTSQSWGSMNYCDRNNQPVPWSEIYSKDYYYISENYQMCGVYDTEAFDIDKYTHENQDMLVLFAAGNDGESGYYTVGDQAQNKNGMAIGASRTSYTHLHENTPPFTAAGNAEYWSSEALWCAFFPYLNTTTATCEELAADYANQFSTDAGCCEADMNDPTWGLILESYGSGISCCIATLIEGVEAEGAAGVADETSVASFSSRGPTTLDYRLKPDVLAPGDVIISAASAPDHNGTHQCDIDPRAEIPGLRSMSGTSMATPHAAAAAALVKQYYEEGFAVSGERSDSGQTPTAALVKATLINSAVPLFGHMYQDSVLGEIVPLAPEHGHQFVTGHGIIRLDNSLAFMGADSGVIYPRLQHFDNQVFEDDGEMQYMEFTIPDNTRHFSVTLVWTDPPAALGSAKQLVNDLDLVVYRADCSEITGNAYLGLDQAGFEGSPYVIQHGRFRDSVNNAERVWVEAPPGGTYHVEVSAHTINQGPQSWAMVINYDEKAEAVPWTCPRFQRLAPDAELTDIDVRVTLSDRPDFTSDEFLASVASALSVDPTERFRFATFGETNTVEFTIHDYHAPVASRQPTALYLSELLVVMAANPSSVLFAEGMVTAAIDSSVPVEVIEVPVTSDTDPTTDPTTPDDSGGTDDGNGNGGVVAAVVISALVLLGGGVWFFYRKPASNGQGLLDNEYQQTNYQPMGNQAILDN